MQIFVRDHALAYCSHGVKPEERRTALSVREIEELVSKNAFVRLSSTKDADFYLVWDHHEEKGVVLLTGWGYHKNERVVISIWKLNFDIPGGTPSDALVEKAKMMSEKLRS